VYRDIKLTQEKSVSFSYLIELESLPFDVKVPFLSSCVRWMLIRPHPHRSAERVLHFERVVYLNPKGKMVIFPFQKPNFKNVSNKRAAQTSAAPALKESHLCQTQSK